MRRIHCFYPPCRAKTGVKAGIPERVGWPEKTLAGFRNGPNLLRKFPTLTKEPDLDGALELLGPVFETLAAGFLDHAKVDPDLDPLRDHPGFKAMVAAAEMRLATARDGGSASAAN